MQIFSGYAAETAAWGNGESFCFTEYNFTAMRVEIQQPVRIKRRQDEYIGLCGKISATVEIRTVQLRFWDRLGGQLLLLSVFADGIGACMG